MRPATWAAVGAIAGLAAWLIREQSGQSAERIAGTGNRGVSGLLQEVGFWGVNMDWYNDLMSKGRAYVAAFRAAEQKYGIPEYLLARLAWQESRFRPDIITGKTRSGAGALGIMQIIPRWNPGVDPLNPHAAIDYAGRKLAGLYKQFGTWELALKAYNWGEGNVRKWLNGQKKQPAETRAYSAQILADLGAFTRAIG